jgi:hypothetical protein
MRSSHSCLMASPFFRFMSLTFSCILCRVGAGRGHMNMGSIGASGGSIVFCGCYLSSACRSISMCVFLSHPHPNPLHTRPELRWGRSIGAYVFFHFVAGLVVFSYCQAHFYPAAWSCVSVCWDDIDHGAECVHRVPQLACNVCVPCCHDRDVRVRLLCAGLCPRCRRRGGDCILLLGGCVSEVFDCFMSYLTGLDINLGITASSECDVDQSYRAHGYRRDYYYYFK